MNIVVAVKLVPDLVEELEIDDSGAALDMTWMRLIINEFDDHAIEQAILLKERGGGQLTVIVPDAEGADDVLYAAAAKGADRLIKLMGDFEEGVNNHALARVLATIVKELQPDLVLTGVQAHDDLDGSVGPLLAEHLGMPYVGYVAGVEMSDGVATARKEYPGGLIGKTGADAVFTATGDLTSWGAAITSSRISCVFRLFPASKKRMRMSWIRVAQQP